ncbi:MAG: Uncharacterised protein [SAR116 cluster bacterium MED-G04]|nr:MAG: Uncharacterised protein [SAR116 cluster bacterium MED-G04]
MRLPPGEPITSTGLPSFSTIVGAMDERGRLPGSTLFAMGTPSRCDRNEKSVNSLLSRNPPSVISRDPKAFSIVVVIDKALP